VFRWWKLHGGYWTSKWYGLVCLTGMTYTHLANGCMSTHNFELLKSWIHMCRHCSKQKHKIPQRQIPVASNCDNNSWRFSNGPPAPPTQWIAKVGLEQGWYQHFLKPAKILDSSKWVPCLPVYKGQRAKLPSSDMQMLWSQSNLQSGYSHG
jgi:hypothetical protein